MDLDEFNSLRLPALILITVPFSLAGMVYTLILTGFPVSATVIIGVLIVVAATINEGVPLITFADDLPRERHLSSLDAVIEAAKIRLRPRMMIALYHLWIHPPGTWRQGEKCSSPWL